MALASCTGKAQRPLVVRDGHRVQGSIEVLKAIAAAPDSAIPDTILRSAQGLAVIPHVLKAAFGTGGRYGVGVLTVRMPSGAWSNPVFISAERTSAAWQWPQAQAVDLVLSFTSRRAVEMLQNKVVAIVTAGGLAVR